MKRKFKKLVDSNTMVYFILKLNSKMHICEVKKDVKNRGVFKVIKYNVTLKELPKRTVASVRKIIPSYNHESMLWGILMEEGAPLNIQPDDPCYTLAIFHDGEHKESNVDVEIQKSVKGTYSNTKNIIFKTVEPILMASATYKGSYDQIYEVNEAVANWVRDNDYAFDGLSFCIYHVSPHETQNPEELVTEVCYPVRKK